MDKNRENKRAAGARNFPGIAIDIADNEEVNRLLVDDETKMLNNNPRNNK